MSTIRVLKESSEVDNFVLSPDTKHERLKIVLFIQDTIHTIVQGFESPTTE